MTEKIAVVQSRIKPEGIERERRNISQTIGERAEVVFLSSLDEGLPWDTPVEILSGYSGVIFGGSSDLDFHGGRDVRDNVRIMSHQLQQNLENFIKHLLAHNIPTIGICFGHQLIGHTFGAECIHDKAQSKYGTYGVHLTEEGKRDAVLGQLPASFLAQYAHKDSLTRLPEGATLMAESKVCNFAALRYGTSMYTFQFHPEVVKFQDPSYSYEPSPEASKIIPLWINKFIARAA